jgi:hypothetical protein
MQILLKDGIQGFVSVYVFDLNCFQLKERISMRCILYIIPEGKKEEGYSAGILEQSMGLGTE